MCLHPKDNIISASELNKITEEINESTTDMDSLNEFSGLCKYIDSIVELNHSRPDLNLMHLNI